MNSLSDRGNGIVNLALDLAIEQRLAGHQVAFATSGGGYELLLRESGIQHYRLEQGGGVWKLLNAGLGFRPVLKSFKPDIVHAHMRSGLLIAWFWSRTWAGLGRIPLVGHLHNVHDRESRLMGLADRVIAVSESVKASMIAQGIAASKLRVVTNGTLGSKRFPPIGSIPPRSLLHPSITTVAGMNHRKGIAELIAAFDLAAAEFPDAHLYLVGDGPERTLFEQQAASTNAHRRIHFEGFQKDPQAYMLSSDVFVLASRRDSCPLVLAEARQAGCAIVASDVDGIPEALDGGRAGMLVPSQNPAALADAILKLLQDDALRDQWRRSSREGLDQFTARRMSDQVTNVYLELASL
jgi:glycosyltransferase involved in cell wall biosynthesis